MKNITHTRCTHKVMDIFEFRGLYKSDFQKSFILLVHMFLVYVRICSHLECFVYFYFQKIWKFVLNFGLKMESIAFEMYNVTFSESTMSKTKDCEWYKRFKKDREELKMTVALNVINKRSQHQANEEHHSGKSPKHYQRGY